LVVNHSGNVDGPEWKITAQNMDDKIFFDSKAEKFG